MCMFFSDPLNERMCYLKLFVLILPTVASSVRTDRPWNYTQVGPRPNESDRFLYLDRTQAVRDAYHLCMFCDDNVLSNSHFIYKQEQQCTMKYYVGAVFQGSMLSKRERDRKKYAFCNDGEVPGCGPPPNTSHNWTCSYGYTNGYTTSSLYSVYSHCHRLCEWSLNVIEALYCNASLMWEVVHESSAPCQAPIVPEPVRPDLKNTSVLPGNEDSGQTLTIVVIAVAVATLLIAVVILVFVWRRRRRVKKADRDIEMVPIPQRPPDENDGHEHQMGEEHPEERQSPMQNLVEPVEDGGDDADQENEYDSVSLEVRPLVRNNMNNEIRAHREDDRDETVKKVVYAHDNIPHEERPLLEGNIIRNDLLAPGEVEGDETLRKVAPGENGHDDLPPKEEEHVKGNNGLRHVEAVELRGFKRQEVMPPKSKRFLEPNGDPDEHHDSIEVEVNDNKKKTNETGAFGRDVDDLGELSVDELGKLQNNVNANWLDYDLTTETPDNILKYEQGAEAIESTEAIKDEGQVVEDMGRLPTLADLKKNYSSANDTGCRPKTHSSARKSMQNKNGKVKVPILEYMVMELSGTKNRTSVSEHHFTVWVCKGAIVLVTPLPTSPSDNVLMFRITRKDPDSGCRWKETDDKQQSLVVSYVTEDDIGPYNWKITYENQTCRKGELDLQLKEDSHQSARPTSVIGASIRHVIRSTAANQPPIPGNRQPTQQPIQGNQQPIQTNQHHNRTNQQIYQTTNQPNPIAHQPNPTTTNQLFHTNQQNYPTNQLNPTNQLPNRTNSQQNSTYRLSNQHNKPYQPVDQTVLPSQLNVPRNHPHNQSTQPPNNLTYQDVVPPDITHGFATPSPGGSTHSGYIPLDPHSMSSSGSMGQGARNHKPGLCCSGEMDNSSDVPRLDVDSLYSQCRCGSESCSRNMASNTSGNCKSLQLRNRQVMGEIPPSPPPLEERGEPAGSENLDTHLEEDASDSETENEQYTSLKEVYRENLEL